MINIAAITSLPSDIHMERALIGCVLLSYDVMDEVGLITPDMFHDKGHQDIWEALKDISGCDEVMLISHLDHAGKLANIGDPKGLNGAKYIYSLKNIPSYSDQAPEYATQVREKYILRTSAIKALMYANMLLDVQNPVSTQAAIMQLSQNADALSLLVEMNQDLATFQDVRNQAIQRLEDKRSGKIPVFSTGYSNLDKKIGGLSPGLDFMIGARTHQGKTLLLLSKALRMEANGMVPFIISPELKNIDILERVLQMDLDIAAAAFKQPGLVKDDSIWNSFISKLKSVNRTMLFDDSIPEPGEIKAMIIKAKKEHGDKLVVLLDKGNLIKWGEYAHNEAIMTQMLANYIKRMANDLGVTVIHTSQVRKEVDQRSDHTPGLADFMYGGETAPDIVASLVSPGYYDPKPHLEHLMWLFILKNRVTGQYGKISFLKSPTSGVLKAL